MPPRINLPLSSTVPWKCSQCSARSFSVSAKTLEVGPEHPRYLDIPEAPQQSVPDRTPVKGTLPVPRNVFKYAGKKDQSLDGSIAEATQLPQHMRSPAKGSRQEWKIKMSESRRRNLREGIKTLRGRQLAENRQLRERGEARRIERELLLNRPEREDERLTAPSHNIDVEALFGSKLSDPSRGYRLQQKRDNLERVNEKKQAERLDNLHTLYMTARDFIVTQEQLEAAIDEAFGTPEKPIQFSEGGLQNDTATYKSIWASGPPQRIQDMLNNATQKTSATQNALNATGYLSTNRDRITRIAEKLTGGQMDTSPRHMPKRHRNGVLDQPL